MFDTRSKKLRRPSVRQRLTFVNRPVLRLPHLEVAA